MCQLIFWHCDGSSHPLLEAQLSKVQRRDLRPRGAEPQVVQAPRNQQSYPQDHIPPPLPGRESLIRNALNKGYMERNLLSVNRVMQKTHYPKKLTESQRACTHLING